MNNELNNAPTGVITEFKKGQSETFLHKITVNGKTEYEIIYVPIDEVSEFRKNAIFE